MGGYRKGQYEDILEALEVMRYINGSTPSTHVYLRVFQLESQVLPRCSETTAPVSAGRPSTFRVRRASEEVLTRCG